MLFRRVGATSTRDAAGPEATGVEGQPIHMNHLRERVMGADTTKAGLRNRAMYQTRHSLASNALAAGEAPSWVQKMIGHTAPAMLFKVYARYVPNLIRRDGSAGPVAQTGALRATTEHGAS
jgi:integrase